tara:strand:+ start:10690 stop:10980 length:291 start_codon:yes stop_codon:yes gene_type:complete
MHSWEVTCIELRENSEYDDCRSIEKIGFKVASQIQKRNIDQAYSMIESNLTNYHVVVNGEDIALVSANVGDIRYVRTEGSDTSEDPLMKLGKCEQN